ncbi:MAG TPA: efflux RND transporter periplasmic adaptor subunit [Usitatibacter sp.]|nr:efflux RND transporter periplasmic adaptor subunit [Usitatibacter sp.]
MSRNTILLAAGAAAFLAIGLAGGYWWAERARPADGGNGASAVSARDAKTGRRILYWHDPMVPGQKFDKPGKSPYMDMDLVPVYADEAGAAGGVSVDPRLAQSLGVRTAVAEKGRLEHAVDAVGTIAFDERAVELVQSRTPAYVEKLYVRAPLDPVRRGQPLAQLFVPEWAGAQQEYLALKASTAPGAAELAAAARNRLLLLNMTEAQVEAVDRAGKPVTHVTLASPVDGVVGELGAREGMNAMAGATLFRLNGLSTVWVNLDIPEALAGAVVPGAPIRATVPAYPGEAFAGRVSAVLPEVNTATRTLRARVELANPGAKLKPGMFATVSIAPRGSRDAVLVPSESVIVTGERALVIVDRGAGRFEPVDVKVGRDSGGKTEILEGVEAGTKVVASGQFLIDSEASLRGVERRMASSRPAPAANATHHAQGRLEQVHDGVLTISHGPVPELKWPAMTMEFAAPKDLPPGLKAGDRVAFDFVATPEGTYRATRVERESGGAS